MILLDTNVLVALVLPRDRLHERAARDLERLARRELRVLASVLTEACFLLGERAQRDRLSGLLGAIRARPAVEPAWQAVFEWLARSAEHEPDWADGCLVLSASREQRVWTYDDEFRSVWRRLDGSRVPLAVPQP
ncbi:MAG: type II toxin-antitoxin system VapC family toxin [Myxococcales bacterium]|nr:type II toxin-antitoxin system VapC family toxin [Myxococcales bacterium]